MTKTTEFPPGQTNRVWPKAWPEWLGSFPRLTGRQHPEYESWHEGDESEGDRVTQFGIKVGVRLLPWEWMIVRAIFSLMAVNEWGIRLYTHRNVVIECTRQQGKTLIMILVILWKLFKRRRRVVYTAQQWKTVEDVFDRVVFIIDRVPSLQRRLAEPPSKKDNHGIILLKPLRSDKHVVKADFGPRTLHFARGFTEIDDLILDEAYDLVPKHTANLTGAQAASSNPQTIYASTPPVVSEHPNCGRFAGFVRAIKAGGAPGLYGALYRAPKSFKRGDPDAYPLAQPSYGVVGDDREMEAHLQGAKDAGPIDLALFDADWLGWGMYPPPAGGARSEISAEKWMTMRNPAPRLIGRPIVVVTREDTWAISAAQRTADGRIHIEVGYADAAAGQEIVDKLVELRSLWNPAAFVVARGEAAEIVPDLEVAGFEPVVPTKTDEAQACGGFLSDALTASTPPLLSHAGQPGVSTAVRNTHKRGITPSGFIWEVFDPASHAQLMGVTLARWGLLKFGAPKRKRGAKPAYSRDAAVPTERSGRRSAAHDEHFNPMTAAF